MSNVIRGQFGKPKRPIEASLSLDLREEAFEVDGEEWMAIILDGELVQVVPIEAGTAPDPKRMAKVVRMAHDVAVRPRSQDT